MARHDLRGALGPDAEEGLQRAGEQASVGKVAGEEEDLVGWDRVLVCVWVGGFGSTVVCRGGV